VQSLVVTPGMPGSLRVADLTPPQPSNDQVLIRTLEVGICGTDREIRAGHVGIAPAGATDLVIGHEVVGQVERDGAGFSRGDLVTVTVRRSCGVCVNCQAGHFDSCLSSVSPERGIHMLDGFASELIVESAANVLPVPPGLGRLAVLAEPTSVCERGLRHARVIGGRQIWEPRRALVFGAGAIGLLSAFLLRLEGSAVWVFSREPDNSTQAELARSSGAQYVSASGPQIAALAREIAADLIVEATGSVRITLDVLGAAANNGVICLLGVDDTSGPLPVESSVLGQEYVRKNLSLFGSVNAARQDWLAALRNLLELSKRFPGLLDEIIGLQASIDDYAAAFDFKGVKATIALA
jgi:glucose 1-dehydrogenase